MYRKREEISDRLIQYQSYPLPSAARTQARRSIIPEISPPHFKAKDLAYRGD